jgi:hypothetical protein
MFNMSNAFLLKPIREQFEILRLIIMSISDNLTLIGPVHLLFDAAADIQTRYAEYGSEPNIPISQAWLSATCWSCAMSPHLGAGVGSLPLIRRACPRLVGEPTVEDGPGEGETTLIYADEDELGPLENLAHAEEVLATIEFLKDPSFGLDKALKTAKADRSFFASPGGRQTQRSISDERHQFLLKQLLLRLESSDRVEDQARAAMILSFSSGHATAYLSASCAIPANRLSDPAFTRFSCMQLGLPFPDARARAAVDCKFCHQPMPEPYRVRDVMAAGQLKTSRIRSAGCEGAILLSRN